MEKQLVIIAILIIQKFIIAVPYMHTASHIDPNVKVFPQISAKPQISAALLTLRSE